MAVGIAYADGNWTGAAVWATVDSTSLQGSEQANTALTTSYVESQTFAPGAITIDGIAVKVRNRVSASAATMSVRLAQAGSLVVGTEVTIDVADLPDAAARIGEIGWVLFKFAAPVLLVAATDYTVSARVSIASAVTLYRNTTSGNWSRMLRTTTPMTLGAGDSAYILGEHTGAGTRDLRAIIMDSTATTDYGNGTAISTTNPPGVAIGNGGSLAYANAASTAYVLRLSTTLAVCLGGTLTIGTAAAPIPRDSTAVLEFDPASADGDFGLEIYGACEMAGLSRTAGLDIEQCLLNTDEAIAQTVLGVDRETGWLNGDEIVVASTDRTSIPNSELRTVSAGDATTVTISAGLSNAHLGTAPMQAEVILLTRNVEIRSTSSTLMAYVFVGIAGTLTAAWVLFRYLGAATAGRRGIEITCESGGSATLTCCAIRDFDRHGLYITGSDVTNIALEHIVGYKVGGVSNSYALDIATPTTGTWVIRDCTFIPDRSANGGVRLLDVGGTLNGLRVIGVGVTTSGLGLRIDEDAVCGDFSNIVVHSTVGQSVIVSSLQGGTIRNVDVWRENGSAAIGVEIDNTYIGNLTLDTWRIWGCLGAGLRISAPAIALLTLRNCLIAGDTSAATLTCIEFGVTRAGWPLRLDACSLSPTSGIFVPATNQDILLPGSSNKFAGDLFLNTTTLGGSTPIANLSNMPGRASVRYTNSGGDDRCVMPSIGTLTRDSTVYRTAAPSEKLTPTAYASPSFRLRSGPWTRRVLSGTSVSPVCYLRRDGSYAGSTPRILLLANPAIGVMDDTVIATMSGPIDTWVLVTGTSPTATADGVMQFVVEVDGSAGNVWMDDWA